MPAEVGVLVQYHGQIEDEPITVVSRVLDTYWMADDAVAVYAYCHESVTELLAWDDEVGHGGEVEEGWLLVTLGLGGCYDCSFWDLVEHAGAWI
jgi:hypothetical protein